MVVIGKKSNRKARNRLSQKKRRQWNVKEKLMIVHYFENNNRNVRGTAKNFNIEPKQVQDWTKKKELLLKTALYVTKLHPGKPPNYPNLEDNLFTWVCEKRANGIAIT